MIKELFVLYRSYKEDEIKRLGVSFHQYVSDRMALRSDYAKKKKGRMEVSGMKWTHDISEDRRAEIEREFVELAERNAELGEPSAACDCECDCGNLAEDIADIKAMIGRLIRNGGDAE